MVPQVENPASDLTQQVAVKKGRPNENDSVELYVVCMYRT